jgi:hypothetical protein
MIFARHKTYKEAWKEGEEESSIDFNGSSAVPSGLRKLLAVAQATVETVG